MKSWYAILIIAAWPVYSAESDPKSNAPATTIAASEAKLAGENVTAAEARQTIAAHDRAREAFEAERRLVLASAAKLPAGQRENAIGEFRVRNLSRQNQLDAEMPRIIRLRLALKHDKSASN